MIIYFNRKKQPKKLKMAPCIKSQKKPNELEKTFVCTYSSQACVFQMRNALMLFKKRSKQCL